MSSTIQYPGKNPGSKFFAPEANEIKTVVNAHVDELPLRWFSGQTYAIDEIVEYGGILYKSLQGSNVNQQPDTEVAYWEEVKTGGGATLEGLMGETSGVAGKVYYRAGDQKFYLADVTDETKRNIIGVLQESVALDEEAVLSLVGTIEDLTGLVDGQEYYLGEAGALVQRNSIPSGAPVIFIGRGNGTTKLDVNVEAYLESPQTVLRRDLGEMFTSYSSSVPAGALGFDYDNAVSIGAYQSLFDLVGHAFNADHVAAGETDLSGSSVSFYPTPTPGKYPRAAFRPASLTPATLSDVGGKLVWVFPSGSAHTAFQNLRDGTPYRIKLISGTLPTGIDEDTVYYTRYGGGGTYFYPDEDSAINATSTNAVNYTDSGSGTFQIEQVGIALDDAFQGHAHELLLASSAVQSGSSFSRLSSSGTGADNVAGDPYEYENQGTPRTSNETRPVTDYVYYYIQAREAANIGPDAYSVPLGDFNISTTGASVDLDSLAEYPNGTVFNVSWYGGVGTAQFSFTGTGYTLNDIDPTSSENWKGDGIGRLQFEKFSATAFYTLDCGEIWDSDGGNFSTGKFKKYLAGYQQNIVEGNKNNGSTASQSFSQALTFSQVDACDISLVFAATSRDVKLDATNNLLSDFTSSFLVYVENGAGTTVADSRNFVATFEGRWTTDTPREISRRSPILFSKGLKEFDPVPLGDFNIATSAASVDLDDLAGYDIGTKFKVSWYGGDGTAKFTFGGTAVTLNGIDPTSGTNWNGDGTGFLKFEKTAAGTFVIVDTPDIWDYINDTTGGQFFTKNLNGELMQGGSQDFGTFSSEAGKSFTINFLLAFPTTNNVAAYLEGNLINGVSFLQPHAYVASTTQGNIGLYTTGGSAVSGTPTFDSTYRFTGLWTTDAPRRT
jgi:hypothetical protein